MKYKFNIEESFKQAWELTKKHFWLMLGVGVVTMLISYALEGVEYTFLAWSKDMSFMYLPYLVLLVIGFLVSLVLTFNTYRIMFDLVDGKSAKVKDLFRCDSFIKSRLPHWLIAQLVYGIIVMLGLIFLIVPGIYLAIKYMYVNMLMIEKDITIKEAFKKSAEMTKGEMWHLIGMGMVCIIVVMLGLILLIIGVVPAIILVAFATMLVYRKLGDAHHHVMTAEVV